VRDLRTPVSTDTKNGLENENKELKLSKEVLVDFEDLKIDQSDNTES